MGNLNDLGIALRDLNSELDAEWAAPKPGEIASGRKYQAAGEARRVLDENVLPHVKEVLAEVDTDDERRAVANAIAAAAGRTAALIYITGDTAAARALLERARNLTTDLDQQIYEEALRDPMAFTQLNYAQWLTDRENRDQARQVARQLLERSDLPGHVQVAKVLAEQREPLKHPPTLFTFNGIGTTVYGRRDEQPNGSYVTTRFFTFIYIPIIPIDAYRVVDGEQRGSYYFIERVPLGTASKLYRGLVAAAAVLTVVGAIVSSHYSSAGYRLQVAMKEVAHLEEGADSPEAREAAIARYETLLEEYEYEVDAAHLEPAAEGIARLLAASVPTPFAVQHADAAEAALRRFATLPTEHRQGAAAETLAEHTSAWIDVLAKGNETQISAALRVANAGQRACGGAAGEGLKKRAVELTRRLADTLAKTWPLAAFRLYCTQPEDPESLRAAGHIVARLTDSIDVWAELKDSLRVWSKGVAQQGIGEYAALAQSVEDRVAQATQAVAAGERTKLLEGGDLEALAAAHTAAPQDQGIAVAYAQLLGADGRNEDAVRVLKGLGPRGMLVTRAQLALASGLGALERWDDAEGLLDKALLVRLPAYQTARGAFGQAAEALENELVNKARSGKLPTSIQTQLNAAASEQEAQRIFSEWLGEQLERDPELQALSDRMKGLSDVVPIALELGTLKLRHASEAGGAQREVLLGDAERAFLAIQSDAAGLPSYHLGLGQVYYRLGKPKEGNRELNELLKRKDPELTLAVARAYRELGMVTRMKQVAKQAFNEAQGKEIKGVAAILLSLEADTPSEREKWLLEADQANPFVQTSLIEVRGDRLAETGEFEQADAKFAEAARRHEENAKLDSTSANNAALAHARRYGCTGQQTHIERAIQLMNQALKLNPESTIQMINLEALLEHRALLGVLTSEIAVADLRLSAYDAAQLFDAFKNGPRGDALQAALQRHPDARRARELLRQAEVLAPQRVNVYTSQLTWLDRFDDHAGIKDLLARLKRVKNLDTANTERQRKQYVSGRNDARALRAAETQLKRLELIGDRLGPAPSTATRAALAFLLAQAHDTLAIYEKPVEHTERRLAFLQQAHELFPELGAGHSLPSTLIELALHQAANDCSDLAQRKKNDWREQGTVTLLHQLLLSGNAKALAAMRKRPELAQAAEQRLARIDSGAKPLTSDWVLAALAKETKLADTAKTAWDAPDLRPKTEIGLLLSPEGARAGANLVERGPKPY